MRAGGLSTISVVGTSLYLPRCGAMLVIGANFTFGRFASELLHHGKHDQ